jgi:hypothetical protein
LGVGEDAQAQRTFERYADVDVPGRPGGMLTLPIPMAYHLVIHNRVDAMAAREPLFSQLERFVMSLGSMILHSFPIQRSAIY